jgi:antitoxin YefM
MRTTTIEKARENLAEAVAQVNNDHEPLLIAGENGAPSAVLMGAQDFASLEETAHLHQSPGKAERLRQAIRDFEAGKPDVIGEASDYLRVLKDLAQSKPFKGFSTDEVMKLTRGEE